MKSRVMYLFVSLFLAEKLAWLPHWHLGLQNLTKIWPSHCKPFGSTLISKSYSLKFLRTNPPPFNLTYIVKDMHKDARVYYYTPIEI